MRLLNRKPDIVPSASEDRFLSAARRYVESAYPNPDRVGCFDHERLDALARRKCSPADHMGEIDHIVTCSPCFVEYHAIRRAVKRRRIVLSVGGLAAAIILSGFSGLLLLRDGGVKVPQPPATRPADIAKDVRQKRVVDLRPYERQRGGGDSEPRRQLGPVILDRALLELTIQLPIGSEEGKYRFSLTDPAGVPKLETSGEGIIKNYITTVEAPFDLRAVSPGQYTLTVRRIEGVAEVPYPVEIR